MEISRPPHYQHQYDGNQQFHQCVHGPLSREEERKKWLKKGSAAHVTLVDTVNDKYLLKGVKVNGFTHTGPLEVYNSAYTKYSTKRKYFPFKSMVVRSKLAALDHNHNAGREQATVGVSTRSSAPQGAPGYCAVCQKARGVWDCKPVCKGNDYSHVYDMMA